MPTLLLGGEGNIDRNVICELREDLAESEHLGMRGYFLRGNREAHVSRKPPSFRAGIGESGEKNLLLHWRWLCSDGSDEQEKQSANGGWTGEGVMPYVQFTKLLGSRTQRSTEEAGEQEDMSTSAEPVEGRT